MSYLLYSWLLLLLLPVMGIVTRSVTPIGVGTFSLGYCIVGAWLLWYLRSCDSESKATRPDRARLSRHAERILNVDAEMNLRDLSRTLRSTGHPINESSTMGGQGHLGGSTILQSTGRETLREVTATIRDIEDESKQEQEPSLPSHSEEQLERYRLPPIKSQYSSTRIGVTQSSAASRNFKSSRGGPIQSRRAAPSH